MIENKNISKTNLKDLGEFKLIEKLTENFKNINSSTEKGIGDDAAVLSFTKKKVVVSTDLLVEGVHFNLAYTPLKHLGYKAIMVNLSDINAMNAIHAMNALRDGNSRIIISAYKNNGFGTSGWENDHHNS